MRKYVCKCGHVGWSVINLVAAICSVCGGVMEPVGATFVEGKVPKAKPDEKEVEAL